MVRSQRVITLKDASNQCLGLHAPTRAMAPKRAGMLVSNIIRFQSLRRRHSAVLPIASSLYPFRVYHHIKFPIITLANPPHRARLLCWLQRPQGAGCERHHRAVMDPRPRPTPHRYVSSSCSTTPSNPTFILSLTPSPLLPLLSTPRFLPTLSLLTYS